MGYESLHERRWADPRMTAQTILAEMAYPPATDDHEGHKATMLKWLEGEKEGEIPLAVRFGAYMDKHPDYQFNVGDEAAMKALLKEVRAYH